MNNVSANDIAEGQSHAGFPAKLIKDGATTVASQQHARNQGRTSLHLEGVLEEQDVTTIQQILSQVSGVTRIGVNIAEAVVSVDHDIHKVNGALLADTLKQKYTCSVAVAGEKAWSDVATEVLDKIRRSEYVESTLSMEGLSSYFHKAAS